MIHKFHLELATLNPAKGNTAYNLTQLEETVAEAAGFIIAERVLLVFGPNGWGGNHKHERSELLFAATGNPTFIYRDETGARVEDPMGIDADGRHPVFVVDPWEPHLLVNEGADPALIYELRDKRFSTNYANLEGAESLRRPMAV